MWSDRDDEGDLPADGPGSNLLVVMAAYAAAIIIFASALAYLYWCRWR